MKERFLLYLNDGEARLFKGRGEYLCTGSWNEVLSYLEEKILHKCGLRLLIDLSGYDVREEKLPPLHFWDRFRYLHYKYAELMSKGGFFGVHMIKEGKDRYLRWVHIPQNDSLLPFITQATGGVFFVSLEMYRYLKMKETDTSPYQIVTYSLPNLKVRHVVFKGKRLLLSRISQSREDIKNSIHYLSRTYPDILEMFHVKHFHGVEPLLQFIGSQKHPIVRFNQTSPTFWWIRLGGSFVILLIILITLMEIGKGIFFENKILILKTSVSSLQSKIEIYKSEKEEAFSRIDLDHYLHLKSLEPDFLKFVQDLSKVLDRNQIRLIDFVWRAEKDLDLSVTFLNEDNLDKQFDPLLKALTLAFPSKRIEVIEAPYNSAAHEVFKGETQEPPISRLKIGMP